MTSPAAQRPAHVWLFDQNHRIYVDANGQRTTSPVYARHWVQVAVVDETSKSWVLANGRKISKKGPQLRGVAFTEEQVEADCWAHENRHLIERQLQTASPEVLKQVAALLGYQAR